MKNNTSYSLIQWCRYGVKKYNPMTIQYTNLVGGSLNPVEC
jgi:hypothetical protein